MPFLHERMLIMQVSLVMAAVAATSAQLALPGCLDKCGIVTIPYPFGVTENCSMGPKFFINCTASGTAFLMNSNISVTNISVNLGEIQVQQHRAYDCYDKLGNRNYNTPEFWVTPPYTISGTKNKFMAIGCDTSATFRGFRANEERFITGCMSLCDSLNSVEQDSCSGIGCCQTSIPDGLKNRTVTLGSYYNHTYIWRFNPCSYAFVVQEGHINFSKTSFEQLNHTELLPMILNWEIGNKSCDAAKETSQNSLCKEHSECVNRNNRSTGYICQCSPGYEGNPYHPNGCQDIDECKASSSCSIGECVNSPGNYSCKCPKGYKNDGINPKSCIKDNRSKIILPLIISLGVLSFCVLLVAIVWIYGKRRRSQRLRYFKAMELLEKKLRNKARIFTESEVKEATNNFSEEQRVGDGRYAIVYKGKLDDQKVAIKKSKFSAPIDQKQSTAAPKDEPKITAQEQFGNEMMTLYQINHNNVVRLVGCCLATKTPIVVYEFIENGSLYTHIHGKEGKKLSLEWRLKIAAQTAGALAYLHHDTFRPIIHGDVKTANILLDENKPKLSDFGASRLAPKEESILDHGTKGYVDPEYLESKRLTKKSDVYSFGVVLAELLTSQKAEPNLANFFVSEVEKGRLDKILDQEVKGHSETVTKVADLAKRCLRPKGKERPFMREVAAELQGLVRIMEQHQSGGEANISPSPKDTGNLVGSSASPVEITRA